MIVFIDESGVFTVPAKSGSHSVSCVGAILIPHSCCDALSAAFEQISSLWPSENGEIKGRLLSEDQLIAAIDLLAAYKGLMKVTSIDMGLHSSSEISMHKSNQVKAIMDDIGPEHHPSLVAEVKRLQGRLNSINNPLYVQIIVQTYLIDQIIRDCFLYVVQRMPEELGKIEWVIDAKDQKITKMEEIWRTLVKPFLQSKSLKKPIVMLEGADYGFFEMAYAGAYEETPLYLRKHMSGGSDGRFDYVDISALMNDMSFQNSRSNRLLQLCDVLVSAVRRSLHGNVNETVWKNLSKIFVQADKEREVLPMVHLATGNRRWSKIPPYHEVMIYLRENCLRMLL